MATLCSPWVARKRLSKAKKIDECHNPMFMSNFAIGERNFRNSYTEETCLINQMKPSELFEKKNIEWYFRDIKIEDVTLTPEESLRKKTAVPNLESS